MTRPLEVKLNELVNKLELMHPNDPGIMRYLGTALDLLLKDEKETIEFLRKCENKNTISWIASLLESLPERFPSQDLLNVFESLLDRFPDDKILLLNFNLAIDEIKSALLYSGLPEPW
jgi:hypothetical protein